MIEPHDKMVDGCRMLALVLLLAAVGLAVCRAQPSPASEAHLRAAIIYNLTKFIDWPSWKLGDAQKEFVIGVIGNDAIAAELNDAVRDKQVQGRPVVVQNVTTVLQAEQCHVLYVENSGRRQFKEMAPKLSKAAVLAISENSLGDTGIVIALPLVANHIQIQVDLKAAQNLNLIISSKLLHLALVTH